MSGLFYCNAQGALGGSACHCKDHKVDAWDYVQLKLSQIYWQPGSCMSCEDCENTNGAFSEAGMWRKIGEFETAMRAEQKQEQRKTKRARKLAKEVTLDQELHSKGWRNPVLDETFPRDYDTRSESGRSDNFAIGQKDVGSMLGAKIEYVGTLSQEDKDFVQSKFGERIGCNSCVDMVIKFSNGMWFTRENIIFTK